MKNALDVALDSVALLAPILGFSVFRVGAQGRRVESVRSEPYDRPEARVTTGRSANDDGRRRLTEAPPSPV
jgi:hypothetical protein